MKNIRLLSLFTALLLTFTATAQISVGVRVGANFANQDFEAEGLSISPDGITGLSFAVPVEIGITESFSVQPELVYIQKGSSFDFEFYGYTTKQETTINYFEIPILAKYKFVTEPVQAYIAAGPVIGFGLGGTISAEVNGQKEEEDIDFERDGLKKSDFGLSIGAGVGFGAGPGQVVVDLRYILGLSNIADLEDGEDGSIKNRGFGIGVGYMFPIGGE